MKNLFLWSIVFILILPFIGCSEEKQQLFDNAGNNTEEPGGTGENEDPEEKTDTINFLLLNDGTDHSEIIPRMIFTCYDWTGIELTEQTNLKYTSFQFVNHVNGDKILVVLDRHSITFLEYDPITGVAGNKVYTITATGNDLRCTQSDFNWMTDEYTIISDSIYSGANPLKKSSRSYEDEFAEEIKEEFYEFFDAIGNSITAISDFLPISGQAICEIWTTVAVPMAQYMLYSDDPEKLKEISNGIIVEEGVVLTVNVTFTEKIRQALNLCYSCFKGAQVYKYFADDNYTDEDYTEEVSYSMFSSINSYRSKLYQAKTEIGELYESYSVSIQVSNVTEHSVTLYGDFRNLDGNMPYISSYGFQYYEDGSITERFNIEASRFPESVTITNLKPGTRYIARAYLRSMGKTYYSAIEYFTTKRVFEISPTLLNFEKDGGEKEVKVTLPSEEWTWTIVSKPEWCEITSITPESFRVKVEENQKATTRNGSITVKAEQSDGTTEEKNLTVEQAFSSLWDGTSWNFEGTIKMPGEYDFHINFGLTIIDVANNKFYFSGDFTGTEKYNQISCNEEMQLVLEYTQKISVTEIYSEIKWKIVIQRTDDMNASATMTGYINVTDPDTGYSSTHYSGTFHGTRN